MKKNIDITGIKSVKPKIKTFIKNLIFRKKSILILGNIYTYENEIQSATLILKSRKTRENISIDLSTITTKNNTTDFEYSYKEEICLSSLGLQEDIYDLYIKIQLYKIEESVEKKVGANYFVRQKIKPIVLVDDLVSLINPYFTFKGKNLALSVEKIQKEIYVYYKTLNNVRATEPLWLIGEQPYKAQDTGYRFFKYMRENFPEKNIYYIIDFSSPEYKNVKDLGNVVNFRSKEHFKLVFMATHIISSHHPEYLYPLSNSDFNKEIKAKKIFIQHGILGTKNIENIYAKTSGNFNVDLFMVSSDKEKKIVVDDLKFKNDEVVITGLSRFDSLLNNDTQVKRQILIIPTWRDWLQTFDGFIESEYYQRYKSLLESDKLQKLCKTNDLELILCLHPNMQKFVDQFNLENVRVISQGEVDVQQLLKESILMITDYSSVAFDFSFLKKPIIYYQFDQRRFLGKHESHLDIYEDLPGDIVQEKIQVLEMVQYYINNQFSMREENYIKSQQFLKYNDTNNSQRIKETIENFEYKKDYFDLFIKSELIQGLGRKFKKNKFYFAIMKRIYRIMKLLPLNEKQIVFESSVAEQYADAPRSIFQKLVIKYPNKKYIWISNKKIYNLPYNCKVVERFSWDYYYYLATSKYWVNNQNFPFYITKRKPTIYLQTWHGTPLKKMLFDLDNVYGRDEGYIKRVEQAKNQWTYLLSQSTYASEKFRSAFDYDGNILELGYPRNDLLINEVDNDSLKNKIKTKISVPSYKKIVLYAPTFRDNSEKIGNKFTMDLAIDFDRFMNQVPDDYILLLRLHVLVKKNITIDEKYKDRILDVSNYTDIQELFLISDILITDYSSVFFDFINLQRPILFYAYDLDSYKDDIRGFYMNYEEEVPGPIIQTEDALYHAIRNIEKIKKDYHQKMKNFLHIYAPKDNGKATQRVIDKVFNFDK